MPRRRPEEGGGGAWGGGGGGIGRGWWPWRRGEGGRGRIERRMSGGVWRDKGMMG